MTIDEVIEEITKSGLNLGAGDFVDVEALKEAVKYLKEYKEMQWISVKDRLPEEDTRVLIVGKRGGVQIARCIECGMHSSGVLWVSDTRKYPKPTHWMPIPEPPTNKEDK